MSCALTRAPAAGLIRAAVERALLDLEKARVSRRLGDIDQQEVVEKHVGARGQLRRRPVLLAIAQVVLLQAVDAGACERQARTPARSRTASAGSRGRAGRRPCTPALFRRTLVCSVRPTQSKRATSCPTSRRASVPASSRRSTPNSEPCAGSSTRWVSKSTRKHSTLSCSSRFRNGFSSPISQARMNGSERRPAKTRNVPSGVVAPLLVVDDEAQRLPVGQRAGPALDRLARWLRFEPVEAETEADLAVTRLERRGVANAGDRHAPRNDRVVGGIAEHRAAPCRREDVRGEHRPRGILRADEAEQIGRIDRWITDLPRSVNVVRHLEAFLAWLCRYRTLVYRSPRQRGVVAQRAVPVFAFGGPPKGVTRPASPGIDFRYSTSAQRCSSVSSGPMTPLPSGPFSNE